MKKKLFFYSDLSNKQLQNLKSFYIQKKIDSMTNQDLREFVLEIITHQINDTIGKEEEMEAWREMSDFFGEEYEQIIIEIQQKYPENRNLVQKEIDPQTERKELIERNTSEKEKTDMWDD